MALSSRDRRWGQLMMGVQVGPNQSSALTSGQPPERHLTSLSLCTASLSEWMRTLVGQGSESTWAGLVHGLCWVLSRT